MLPPADHEHRRRGEKQGSLVHAGDCDREWGSADELDGDDPEEAD